MILYLGGEELISLDLTRPADVILSGDGGGDVGPSPLSNDDLTSMNFLLPGPERSLLPVRLLLAARISLLTLSAIPQPTQQKEAKGWMSSLTLIRELHLYRALSLQTARTTIYIKHELQQSDLAVS